MTKEAQKEIIITTFRKQSNSIKKKIHLERRAKNDVKISLQLHVYISDQITSQS